MSIFMEQIDKAANLASHQAQKFRNLAAAETDEFAAQRLLGRAEALCNARTELCSLSMTDYHRRRALTKLLLHTAAAAAALAQPSACPQTAPKPASALKSP